MAAAGAGVIDHYAVLGLPSGEEGAKLTIEQIKKAYKRLALKLHPDKRAGAAGGPINPNAHEDAQQLILSYKILTDEKSRKVFDDSLIRTVKKELYERRRHYEPDSKRRKMEAELREREQAAKSAKEAAVRKEKERDMNYRRKLEEEIARITNNVGNKRRPSSAPPVQKKSETRILTGPKVLLARWVKKSDDYYSEDRLRNIFSYFGKVEDIVVRPTDSESEWCAFVEMSSSYSVAAAAEIGICGDFSNPLHVSRLQPTRAAEYSPSAQISPIAQSVNAAYEDYVMKKMLNFVAKSKSNGGDNL